MPGGRGRGWGQQGQGQERGGGRGGGGRGGGWGVPLEPALLTALAARPGHGYDLRNAVETMTGSLVPADSGGLYRLLRRLEDAGLVTSTWAEGTHGPQRRQYQITSEGLETLVLWREHLHQRVTVLRTIVTAIDDALPRHPDHRPGNKAGPDRSHSGEEGALPCRAETEQDHEEMAP